MRDFTDTVIACPHCGDDLDLSALRPLEWARTPLGTDPDGAAHVEVESAAKTPCCERVVYHYDVTFG